MKLVVQSVQYLQYLQSSGVQCCRAASRCLPRCLRRPWGLIINQLHCHQHHHHNQNHHQKHHDHDQVGGVMDEGTIGRNASAMRENVSHILTKVVTINEERNFGGFRNCLMFHHNINRDICMWIVLESVWEKQRHNGLWNYTQKHSTVIWNGFEHGGWTREHLAVLRRPSKMEVYHRDIGNIIAHMYMASGHGDIPPSLMVFLALQGAL